MNSEKDYLSILEESLEKKKSILDEILDLNEQQKDCVSVEEFDEDRFDELINKKDVCIKQIEGLDKGFESVYEHVREVLQNDGGKYAANKVRLKKLVSDVTEKSMDVQISEKRNEKLVYSKLSEERKKIHKSKVANKVASDYYKNMSRANVVDPQFLDKKK